MATSTPYLQMHRPADDGSESMANPVQDFNENYDIIEKTLNRVERGWNYIDGRVSGSGSGNFVIDITKGGRFPVGTFKMIQIYLQGNMSIDNGALGARINEDSTTIYVGRRIVFGCNGDVDQVNESTSPQWVGPRWDNSTHGIAILTLFKTDVLSRVPMIWEGGRPDTTLTSRSISVCSGVLTADRLVDRVQIVSASGGGSTPNSVRWRVKGLRVS